MLNSNLAVHIGIYHDLFVETSQSIKFISKCKNSAHSKHVMHLGGTARRIALTAAQCYSFIYK